MMPGFTDQDRLKNVQYRDASNLQARGNLHARFGTNKVGWLTWYFDRLLQLPPDSAILEVGCGPGWIWKENAARIPPGWRIALTDLSPGMMAEARANLAELHPGITYTEADVQQLPFPDATYDAVVANHMLYHVPDLEQGLSEIRRVLKPGGTLFAATNGREHMQEMREIAHEVYAGIPAERIMGFGLENGTELLSPHFVDIRLERYDNTLRITEAEALKAYIRSMQMAEAVGHEVVAEIERRIDGQMERDGVIDIRARAGVFTARKAT
jgi:ubiquinone/menaquinone biosynthesis C-methylase UbiE